MGWGCHPRSSPAVWRSSVARPASSNPEAYRLALKAATLIELGSRPAIEQAEELARRALAMDPGLALAKRSRADVEFQRFYYGWEGDRRNLELAQRFLEEAIDADPNDSRSYQGLLEVQWMNKSEQASPLRAAIASTPSFSISRPCSETASPSSVSFASWPLLRRNCGHMGAPR